VEHGGGANARAEVPGIGGDHEQCIGGRAEQQVVNHCLVLSTLSLHGRSTGWGAHCSTW